jgi:hypothetical protein
MLCNNCTHILPQNFKHQIFSQSGWILLSSLLAMLPMLGGFVVLGSRSLEDQKFKVLHYHHNLLVAKNSRFLATMLLGYHPPQLGSYWHVSYCSFDTA